MSNVQSCFIPTTRNPVKKGTCMSMSLFSSPWLRWDSWAVWKSSYSKKWVGRQKKTSLHIMCVLKNRISLISTDGLTRYSVVLIQLILYIYIYVCVYVCMIMYVYANQRKGSVLGNWRGSAGKVDVPHPHHALWACDLQWRFSQDQNTT